MSHATRPGLPVAGLPGTVAGYRLDGYVGQGSRAVVYLAQDERLQRRVALKVMMPELARDTGFRTRMISESRAAAALGHPHIVPVFQADETDGTLYAAMRYVTGGDGRSLLSRHGPLPLGKAWRVIAQIASALDAAHAHGLIHRDVRPANILLDSDDAGDRAASGRAYLSDFGMSQAFPPGQVIAPDQAAGILDYLAPEQIEGRDLDGRTDQYSLACTGFELLCGTPPFGPDQGQTLMYAQIYADPPAASARRAGIPAAVDSVLATALAKDPADRYPSCGRFAAELRAALGLRSGEPADPPRSPAPRGSGPRIMLRAAPAGRRPAASRPASDAGQPGRAASQAAPAANEPHAEVTDPPTEPGPQIPATAGDPGGPDPGPSARLFRTRGPVLAAGAAIVVAAAVVSGIALSGRSAPAHPAASTPAPTASSPSAVLVAVAVIAVSDLIAVGAGHGLAAGGRPGRAADLERRRPDGAAQRGHPGGRVHQPVRRGRPAPGRSESARRAVWPGLGPAHGRPPGRRAGEVQAAGGAGQLADGRPGLPVLGPPAAEGRMRAEQPVGAYNAAFSASQRADAAKQAFVQVWNPVAARYGIAQKSPRDI